MLQGTGIKNTVAKRDHNSKAKVNKGNHDLKKSSRPAYLLLVFGGSTAPRRGLDGTTKKPVEKVVRKAGRHTPNPSSRIDSRSEPESCQWEEALPSITTPCKKTKRPINVVLPSTSNWPWGADMSHTTGSWTHSSCPAIVSFSNTGIDVIIN